MIRRPTRSTRTDTLFPYTTLFRLCLADGETVFIGGVMEHIEQAGVHPGDSACSLPPYSLSVEVIAEIKRQTSLMARALNVKGLMNVQFAIQDGDVYVLEVNPRASRTVDRKSTRLNSSHS